MRYKPGANDESWLPEGPGHKLLKKEPKGAPPPPRPATAKMLEVNALADGVKKMLKTNCRSKGMVDEIYK